MTDTHGRTFPSLILSSFLSAAFSYCGPVASQQAATDEQADKAPQPARPRYAYQADMKLVAIQKHGEFLIGTLDSDGEFLRDLRVPPLRNGPRMRLLSLFVPTINKPSKPGERVFEFRDDDAKTFIKGMFDAQGRFVPEVGSEVGRMQSFLDAYRPNESMRVYNFPGLLYNASDPAAKKAARMRHEELRALLGVFPQDIGTVNRPVEGPFVFEGRNYPRVSITRDGIEFGGTLDQAGNFVRDTRFLPVGGILPDGMTEFPGEAGLAGDILGEPRYLPRINLPDPFLEDMPEEEKVYELRGDRLLPGKLTMQGRFIPEVGGKVIKFERLIKQSYPYRIYNLPGRFVRVER